MREMLHGTTSFPPLPVSVKGGLVQRKCMCGKASGTSSECEGCSNKLNLSRGVNEEAEPSTVPPIVHEVLRSPGRPLDTQVGAFMESRLGHDFSQVRVHTDERAAHSARLMNALAYTVGRNVVFGAGQYAPQTQEGRRLVAHELTHVAQQGAAHVYGGNLEIGARDSYAEHEAAENAARVSSGRPSSGVASSPGNVIQRDPPRGAPIESERDVTLTPHLDPNLVDLSLGILRGEHRVRITPGLSNPLNIFGTPIPGMQPSQLSFLMGYENRCNRAFQGALLGMRQTQPAGRFAPDFGRNPTEFEARGSFRAGSLLIQPGGTIGFTGSTFDSFALTLTFTRGVSTQIPEECVAPPERPTREPERPTEPGPGPGTGTGTHDDPGTTPDRDRDRPRPEPTLPSYTVYFFYDTTITRPESNSTFERIVTLLQTVPSLHVMLTGHASLEGTEEYNMGLSERRADAMRLRLSLEGVAASRIHTLHFGESAPAVPEPDVGSSLLPSVERIRNLNRRVEVTFFDPTGGFASQAPQLNLPTLGWSRRSPLATPSLGAPRLDQ